MHYLLLLVLLMLGACSNQRPPSSPTLSPDAILEAMQAENDYEVLKKTIIIMTHGSVQAQTSFPRQPQYIENYEPE